MIMVLALVGDNILKVVVEDIVAINPHIVRVAVYTYSGNIEESTNDNYKYYELAIPIEDFTEEVDGNVAIDGDKFQNTITKKIIDSNKASNLAVFINALNLQWEVLLEEQPIETKESQIEGKILAYGNDDSRVE